MTAINEQSLTERQKLLAACACLMAKGDLGRLEQAVRTALDNGVTINELKETFSQLYAYTGFPRSLNALNTLERVLDERKKQGIADDEGKPFARPAVWDDAAEALRLGTEMQTKDEGGTPWDYTFCPQADFYMKSHLFGHIYASDQLPPADRELITLAALSGMTGVAPQFEGHKKCAVFMGNPPEIVAELCAWLQSFNANNSDNEPLR